jgi:Transglycosylase SLT domain
MVAAVGLLGTGLYAGGLATAANAEAPAAAVTSAVTPVPTSDPPTATPTPEPTPTPTPEPPTPTPTPAPTPTPTPTPPAPSPTPTPTPTPDATAPAATVATPPADEHADDQDRHSEPTAGSGHHDSGAIRRHRHSKAPETSHHRSKHAAGPHHHGNQTGTSHHHDKPATTPHHRRKRRPADREAPHSRPTTTHDAPTQIPPTEPAASAPAAPLLPDPQASLTAPVSGTPSVLPATPTAAAAKLFIADFPIPPFLLPVYQAAGARYDVPWEALAAINEIETDYGRNATVSSAGATGWMQFMPSTWAQYGTDANGDGIADPNDPVDAIFAAARYLRAAGADHDLRTAVFAYNHADWYVDSVLARARRIQSLPRGLVESLTGLARGRFPVVAHATYAVGPAGSRILTHTGAAVVAVSDGRITSFGRTRQLGRFLRLRDHYGNTYTYARLKQLGQRHHGRPAQIRLHARRANGIRFTPLRPGMRVAAGTILGRIGRTHSGRRPQVLFQIRGADNRTSLVDPKPILAGWRLLRATGRHAPGRAQMARISAPGLARRVLSDPRIQIYPCGRDDIQTGQIDQRVLATLELLAGWKLDPTVSALKCGHSLMTTSGNISEHSTGDAVDISAINGSPILGHQGPGSITETVVRHLLTLNGVMQPHQIITLMQFPGAANTLSLPDHANHIHIGWRPRANPAGSVDAGAARLP